MTVKAGSAVRLAKAGWRIIPLVGKKPVLEDWLNKATTDPETIERWWSKRQFNVGAVIPESHVVIDIDPQNGGSRQALEELAGVELPPTMSVLSGRGRGSEHLHYLRPFPTTTKVRMPAGIDVLTNAQVVMPPSVHPETGRRYRWGDAEQVARLPLEIASLIRPRPLGARSGGRVGNIGGLISYVRRQPRGQRHDAYHWALRRAVEQAMPERHVRKLVEAATDLGFTEREAQRMVESVRKATA